MSKRFHELHKELGLSDIEITIDSESVKQRVNDTLNADLAERKIYMKYKIAKTIAIAAAITGLAATSAFAMSPAGQEAISNIITYFQSDKAVEMTSIEELSKYNEEIGKSVTKEGITLTLDNVAADNNFIHVFYTVKSEDIPFYEDDRPNLFSDRINHSLWVECVINGNLPWPSNHNSINGYFADNYTYKAACKYNIATMDIPDKFKIELYGDIQNRTLNSVFNKLWDESTINTITDEERATVWYVSADIDKSEVQVNCITKDINIDLPWTRARVEKVVFSPFGNQLVMTSAPGTPDPELGYVPEETFARVDQFALYDENGNGLDLLNTDLSFNADGSSRNSIEFLKADKDTKQLKFVPMKYIEYDGSDIDIIEHEVGSYPLTYKKDKYGSVIITDIRFSDGEIDIDYYKDGFIPYNPGFYLNDANGETAEPGGKLGCTLYTDTHYDTNSYTARYVYEKYDKNGNPIPADETVSAENLKNKLATVGMSARECFELDFDNAVTVDLK